MTEGPNSGTDVALSTDGADARPTGEGDEVDEREPDITPATAFQQLGNEVRVDVVRHLGTEEAASFSTLFDRSESDSSAGFAYHLRQLDGQFLRQRDDERWELTSPGREAARAVLSGRFTNSADRESLSLSEPCPRCREPALCLSVSDGVADVTCEACATPVVRLSFPPSGLTRDDGDLPGALDTYHRNRISAFADGVCPDCGGPVETTPRAVPPETDAEEASEREPRLAQLEYECTRCSASVDCPVTLAVLDHPRVVSFYDDHGEDPSERPVWNVGPEWRERVLSTDPWCLLVSTRLDGDVLELYVGGDGTVHAHRRHTDSEGVDASEETDATEEHTEATAEHAESEELGDSAAA